MTERLLSQLEGVETREELSDFVLALVQDLRDNEDNWENQNLPTFLEAISAWIRDMDGFYANQGKDIPHDVPWKIFADILFAARSYE